MRTFLPDLRDIEGRLPLPIPRRVRILRELESDLEALQQQLVERGVPPEDARLRARATLMPGGAALDELARLHTPRYEGWTRDLPSGRLRVVERTALALASASAVALGAIPLFRSGLLSDPSVYLWPVLAAGAVLFWEVAARGFDLWIRGRHDLPARDLSWIPVLAGCVLAVGLTGALLDLHRLAGLASAPGADGFALVGRWVPKVCVLLSVAILLALAGALAWLCMSQWLAGTRQARHDLLGSSSFASLLHGDSKNG